MHNAVKQFMTAADQTPSDEVARLYLALTLEEISETLAAEGYSVYADILDGFSTKIKRGKMPDEPRDHQGGFDGGIDSLWVIFGYLIARGYPIDEGWTEIARSNMSKMVNGKLIKDAAGKVIKGPDYTPPDLASILGAQAAFV